MCLAPHACAFYSLAVGPLRFVSLAPFSLGKSDSRVIANEENIHEFLTTSIEESVTKKATGKCGKRRRDNSRRWWTERLEGRRRGDDRQC